MVCDAWRRCIRITSGMEMVAMWLAICWMDTGNTGCDYDNDEGGS